MRKKKTANKAQQELFYLHNSAIHREDVDRKLSTLNIVVWFDNIIFIQIIKTKTKTQTSEKIKEKENLLIQKKC